MKIAYNQVFDCICCSADSSYLVMRKTFILCNVQYCFCRIMSKLLPLHSPTKTYFGVMIKIIKYCFFQNCIASIFYYINGKTVLQIDFGFSAYMCKSNSLLENLTVLHTKSRTMFYRHNRLMNKDTC